MSLFDRVSQLTDENALLRSQLHDAQEQAKRDTETIARLARDKGILRAAATCQKATNPSQISSESATPGLRTDNPMAEPVMGGLPRYDGEKLGTPAN